MRSKIGTRALRRAGMKYVKRSKPAPELLTFICRPRGGSERQALEMAAQRVTEAWLPHILQSRRKARRKAYEVSAPPLLSYMWVRATPAQRDHLLESKLVHGPLWYLDTPRKLADYYAWRAEVEAAFDAARESYVRNTRQFHHNYKRGQAVRLRQQGMDTFFGKFRAQVEGGQNDGLLEVGVDMMGQEVTVFVDPYDVAAQ